jgi:hypothetical protein
MSYLSDDQAIEIWKAKWSGTTVQTLTQRYRANPFRIYEVLTEQRNSGTRIAAFEQLKVENPLLAARVDPSPHIQRRMVVPRPTTNPDQLNLF